MTLDDTKKIDDASAREKAQQQLLSAVNRIASIAGSSQNILSYVLIIGTVATSYLVWVLYSAESALWWNLLKGVLVAWPVLILGFTWTVLGQLHEAPDAIGKLNKDTRTAYAGMKEVKIREPKGLRGMFSVLNAFRREGSLESVFETVGGITLLLNPVFLLLVCVSIVMMFLLSLTALLSVLF